MRITKSHGNGGRQTQELIDSVFKKRFASPVLEQSGDAAVIELLGRQVGMTTDGFVVKPYRFQGGDIGKLSICGTVNDLAVSGFKPLYMTAAFQIEEGFMMTELEEIVQSMADTANQCGVSVVAGDTKVVGRGEMDGIFITTAGIGTQMAKVMPSFGRVKPEQSILVSGDIGRHGACIYAHNTDLNLETGLTSDCASLISLAEELFNTCNAVYMRDLTRGGLATALNEVAAGAGFDMTVEEAALPVSQEVAGVCDILGLDACYLACEGRLAVIVESEYEAAALEVLKKNNADSACIGRIGNSSKGQVNMRTAFGGTRLLDRLYYEMLPRIC